MSAKVFPKLEAFLDALGFLYCTDEHVRDSVERLGIRFKALPQSYGAQVAARAQAIGDFKLARHELSHELTLLEMGVQDFKIIPRDDLTLQEKLNALLEEQRVYELCLLGQKDPRAALEQIKNFQETLSANVNYGEFDALMNVYLHEWKEKVERGEDEIIIPGFERLSKMIGGFNPGRIAILLAETGFGKTNLGLLLALAARHSLGSIYFNMEMSYTDICKRIATLESKSKHKDFYQNVRREEWIKSFSDNGKGFVITDGRTLSPNQVKALVRNISRIQPVGFVVVDYDQCLELEVNRDTPEWKALQKTLADFDNFAKEMNCFILVLSQINRDGEISASHRALFKAHTVLNFRNDETHGPIIHAKKNRHGKANAALKVEYIEDSSEIIECEVISLSNKKQKREIKLPKTAPAEVMRYPYAD